MLIKEKSIIMKTNSKSKYKNSKYTYAVGRRKTSSARVRLFKGRYDHLVNNMKVFDFVGNENNLNIILKPLVITGTLEKYYFSAQVLGGGKTSQIQAVVHGISRALVKIDLEKYKSILKSNGFLTRDPREKLRRMVGTGGKARRQKQSPKR